MNSEDIQKLIQRMLGIDVSDPLVRQRAWQRQRVFKEIAEECERDGNQQVADALRLICQQATNAPHDDEALVCLALLAGLEDEEKSS